MVHIQSPIPPQETKAFSRRLPTELQGVGSIKSRFELWEFKVVNIVGSCKTDWWFHWSRKHMNYSSQSWVIKQLGKKLIIWLRPTRSWFRCVLCSEWFKSIGWNYIYRFPRNKVEGIAPAVPELLAMETNGNLMITTGHNPMVNPKAIILIVCCSAYTRGSMVVQLVVICCN